MRTADETRFLRPALHAARRCALWCALLGARLALPDECPQLRVGQAFGFALLPALLRLGEIRPGLGEAILDSPLKRRAREPLRFGLGPALRTHLLRCLLGAGRGRCGSSGGRRRRRLGSARRGRRLRSRGRRRGLGSRWSFLRVSRPEAEANDESDDEEVFHNRDFLELEPASYARGRDASDDRVDGPHLNDIRRQETVGLAPQTGDRL
jgi:hypothetical protein